jgi:hypothetical protein
MEFQEVKRIAWLTIAEVFGLSQVDAANFLIMQPPSYTVLTVPSAVDYPRGVIFVSDEAGGSVLAFSDGIVWRRCTDRAVIS